MQKQSFPPRTVLLKLGGEVFGDPGGGGLAEGALRRLAGELLELRRQDVRLGIVVGGGNVWRGRDCGLLGRIDADHIGILATALNGLALQGALRAQGADCELQSAVPLPWAAPPDPQRARRALDESGLVVFVGGTGNPLVSTDTAAAVRAVEIGAGLLLKGSTVDGVYDRDPKADPAAKRFAALGFDEVLQRQPGVMDLAAFALCREHGMPILVFDVRPEGSLAQILRFPERGTLIR